MYNADNKSVRRTDGDYDLHRGILIFRLALQKGAYTSRMNIMDGVLVKRTEKEENLSPPLYKSARFILQHPGDIHEVKRCA